MDACAAYSRKLLNMNIVTVSGAVWHRENDATRAIIAGLIEGRRDMQAVLDFHSVQRAAEVSAVRDATFFVNPEFIDIARWLRPYADDYQVDLHAMSLQSRTIKSDSIIALDASGYPARVVRELSKNIRQTWFPLPEWPTALIIIVNDADLLDVSEAFMDTFYIRPRGINATESLQISKRIAKKAAFARMFGLKAERLQRNINRTIGALVRKKP
jgi:hypothetical protein